MSLLHFLCLVNKKGHRESLKTFRKINASMTIVPLEFMSRYLKSTITTTHILEMREYTFLQFVRVKPFTWTWNVMLNMTFFNRVK